MPPSLKAMRIDVYLCEMGLANSRTDAKTRILNGDVSLNSRIVKKPSQEVLEGDDVQLVNNSCRFVSRGGLKLEGALGAFEVSAVGKKCIDIGASTGGFTDCLLQSGAEAVIALDTGTSQLSGKLIADGRVTSIENYNARYLKAEDLPYEPELAVMDVSFISATYIIPSVFTVLCDGGDFICLVKPQFEVGRANIGKGGIVKDQAAREMALSRVIDFACAVGFKHLGSIVSPIKGGEGNIEYLVHFRK